MPSAFHCLDTRRRSVRYHRGVNLVWDESANSDIKSSTIMARISVGDDIHLKCWLHCD